MLQSSDEEAECLGGSGAKWATAGAGAGPAQAMEDDRVSGIAQVLLG